MTVWECPSDLEDIRRFHDGFGVICVDVAVLRTFDTDITIARAPLVGNLNHCEIYPRLSGGQRKACKSNARWVHYPEWVSENYRGAVEHF